MRDSAYRRRDTRRFDDDDYDSYEDKRYRHRLHRPPSDGRDRADGLGDGERWSTWEQSSATERGPRPYPAWLVTESAATDTELGILKTGKEAGVFLLRPRHGPVLPARRQEIPVGRAPDVPP